MFEATRPVLFCDYFRIPYRAVTDSDGPASPPRPGLARLWRTGDGGPARSLAWPVDEGALPPGGLLPAGEYRVGEIPVFCRVMPDRIADAWLGEAPGGWAPAIPVLDAAGRRVAAVRRDRAGNVFLPFDPAEAIRNYWSEAYLARGRARPVGRLKRLAMRGYYRARPALPRPAQLGLRRAFSRLQSRARFPRWPLEPALHDLYDLLFQYIADVAGGPVPWLAPWPGGHSWALVLTHDVETAVGYAHLHLLRGAEARAGYRSSWNFVPRRYAVDDATVRELTAAGWEVGVHGLYHDGRDLASLRVLKRRLPAMREHAARWGASGFRSPATHRVWEWMPLLGFDYDSSYPDTDPYEPQAGGCCSLLPYFNGDLVELPLTLPQDHTLFAILGHTDETAWVEKAEQIRARGGMALLNAHPDYLLEDSAVRLYERFLARFAADEGAWRALPREVGAWWRRRAASHLEPAGEGWRVVGPAAGEGRIVLALPR